MKHDWDHSDYGRKATDMQVYDRRICKNCGAEQSKHATQVWMRVTGYHWYPLAGRCKPKHTNT